ncbi:MULTISPECIES: flagellar biosynthesis protein FlhB [Vibrio]|uniref:flagellar biosynthesis protein FlhB n=1 Tax=Vibrio TaxID=662 RepID=UPI000B5C59DE|nr:MULTISPECIES: flagellar biosynthesis protein FlhB [Vibrio]HBV77558.1 flagellar biosynthesis protein FlhB [Vibrio sp.]
MSSEKTENASVQKLNKARKKGDIPRAKEFITAIALMSCILYYAVIIPTMFETIKEMFIHAYSFNRSQIAQPKLQIELVGYAMYLLMMLFVPLLFIKFIVVILGSTILGGFSVNVSKLAPKFNKINPGSGIKRIFSKNTLVEFLKSILKITIFFMILYYTITSNINVISPLVRSTLNSVMAVSASIMITLTFMLVAVIVIFGLIDLPYQKLQFMKQMKMSKQELKDEYKESEGDPQTKGRMKQIQMQMSKNAATKTVPTANVILMNPTHYAVALKYDLTKAEAPFLVAKGEDAVAFYIKSIADKHNIEVITSPELTRSIFYTTKINQMVPSQLYSTVAQVLHYVNQLKSFKNGNGIKPNTLPNFSIPEKLRF